MRMSCRRSVGDHSCKINIGGEGIHLGEGGYRWHHSLFIFIDTDAFRAYWLSLHGIKGFPFDGILTVLTDEAIWMPLRVQCGNVILHDRFIAAAAFWREHVEVVRAAVGLAIPFVKTILAELLPTLRTEEVLCVPRFLQSRHAFIEDGSVAVSASRREKVVIVGLAVRPAIALEEVPRTEFLITMSTSEVFRMPRAAQRCDHLSDDGFLAGVAASLLRGLYSLAAHVCPQRSEHVFERGGFGLARAAAVVLLPGALLAVHVRSALASGTAHRL